MDSDNIIGLDCHLVEEMKITLRQISLDKKTMQFNK